MMMSSPGWGHPLLPGDLVSLLQATITTGGGTVGGVTGGVTAGIGGGGAGAGLATGGAGAAGAGLLGSGTALSTLFSTLLPGLGLGLLKGLFLAELLKPQKKGKGYGYEGPHHYKQRMGLDYTQYPRYPDYLTPHSTDGQHYYDGSF